MVHDVDSVAKGKVVLTMYADDLAIWRNTFIRRLFKKSSSYVKHNMRIFKEAVDEVSGYMFSNLYNYRASLSPLKKLFFLYLFILILIVV